ncbi:hypothetical protein H257_00884 [Aphanomyces astaci]|uniref:Uncharacterized protein n=1 Tax=Aphanomyces astaci TaxID=112090 RepID=W4HDN7_APHAT|nr:hypothetical protein H257_00884 [Aphanomyces astaci]ETV89701.1 hypothetical protein H257_00884 [Aphanomyces astaci]|eukprot:XP_009822101.1 hypothetical protein H257_00884 [Aphanomyces astaci]
MLPPQSSPPQKYVLDESSLELDMTRLQMESVDRQFGIESSYLMQTYYTHDEDDAILLDLTHVDHGSNEESTQIWTQERYHPLRKGRVTTSGRRPFPPDPQKELHRSKFNSLATSSVTLNLLQNN